MAYDEKFRDRAVEYKESGHTFKEAKEVLGICSYSYYQWEENKESTGQYAPPKSKQTRKRKIDPEELKKAVDEKPDAYLRELAKRFNCTTTSIHNRLKQIKITYKKNIHILRKIGRRQSRLFEKIEKIPVEKRTYIDECGIDKCLVREHGRAVRGVKVEDVKRGRKLQRVNVVAAQFKDEHGNIKRVAAFCYKESMNSERFEDWFKTKFNPSQKETT